ncbi:hypothetical protein [Capnocytophaga sp. G2]|uniref:hypothetical protein n=1 Tax=Capnocytophaga sp. G2 TaxID=3110695 RepID=UPI002B464AC2|nr:hypothetical protein [Capnocytophaga sp. G2]MEB3004258.1 hypothetical protein [Capnocytophaga sp. G2]
MILDEFKRYTEQIGAQLSGILSVSFIGTEHGEILYNQSFSGLDYSATAKFEAEIAKNALQEIRYIDNIHEDSLREITISNNEQIHVIYVSKDFDYLIHIITDATKVNYGLLSIIHKQCYEAMTKVVTFDEVQNELYPEVTKEAPKKESHFRKLFFS